MHLAFALLIFSLAVTEGSSVYEHFYCGYVKCTRNCDEEEFDDDCPVCRCTCVNSNCMFGYTCRQALDPVSNKYSMRCCEANNKLNCLEPGDNDPMNSRAYA